MNKREFSSSPIRRFCASWARRFYASWAGRFCASITIRLFSASWTIRRICASSLSAWTSFSFRFLELKERFNKRARRLYASLAGRFCASITITLFSASWTIRRFCASWARRLYASWAGRFCASWAIRRFFASWTIRRFSASSARRRRVSNSLARRLIYSNSWASWCLLY